MPTDPEEKARSVADFVEFLSDLSDEGFEFVVIGGCAVGAYASLQGDEVYSADIDLYTTHETLEAILHWAPKHGGRVVKRPRPRSVQVAVVRWQEKEVNLLTETVGLPAPSDAVRLASEFHLRAHGDLKGLGADPFDLLACKIQLARPKDIQHAEILKRFVEEEIVEGFGESASPRKRLDPARRYLRATGTEVLPSRVIDRLIPLAKLRPDFRFLVHHAESADQVKTLLDRGEAHEGLCSELKTIAHARGFPLPD